MLPNDPLDGIKNSSGYIAPAYITKCKKYIIFIVITPVYVTITVANCLYY